MKVGSVGSCCRFLYLILLVSVARPLQAQTQAPDSGNTAATIKTQVRLVLVDVVVTNGKGEAVTDLRKEDFEVLEDGRSQAVSGSDVARLSNYLS
jgi:hypothetical protein